MLPLLFCIRAVRINEDLAAPEAHPVLNSPATGPRTSKEGSGKHPQRGGFGHSDHCGAFLVANPILWRGGNPDPTHNPLIWSNLRVPHKSRRGLKNSPVSRAEIKGGVITRTPPPTTFASQQGLN